MKQSNMKVGRSYRLKFSRDAERWGTHIVPRHVVVNANGRTFKLKALNPWGMCVFYGIHCAIPSIHVKCKFSKRK